MKKTGVLALGVLAAALPFQAQNVPSPPSSKVTVTVTVVGRGQTPPPAVPKESVVVHQDKQVRPVLQWERAQGNNASLDLAIVIDDALDTSVGTQLSDLASFIRGLPATTRVGVAYSSNGMARFQQDFTSDHELAAKALRLPFGSAEFASGIYESLVELSKHWRSSSNRRAVIVVSSGIDLLRGIAESQPGMNPDLQAAIDEFHRGSVTAYSIYASDPGRLGRNFFLTANGQGSLSRLTAETGGDSYFQGFQTPISFEPYLEDIRKLLDQQYLLTFQAQPGKKGGFARLKVMAEERGAVLIAPDHVWIPAQE